MTNREFWISLTGFVMGIILLYANLEINGDYLIDIIAFLILIVFLIFMVLASKRR